jgi:hypothetical protein
VLSQQHDEERGRDAVRKCQTWQCKSHATPKLGLWLNSLLDVRALIAHSTQGFVSFCFIGSTGICCLMLYFNLCNILVVLGDGIVRLYPILGDLGCISAHIKYIQLLHFADTLCLLSNQSHVCHIRYIVTQF